MTTKQRKPRTKKPKRTATELLNDPGLVTVSLAQASLILGIGRTTAHIAVNVRVPSQVQYN